MFADQRVKAGIFMHPSAETRAPQQAGGAAMLWAKKGPANLAGQD
jgi:hypothetical protein